jgi:hypothetical protein
MPETWDLISISFLGSTDPVATIFLTISVVWGATVRITSARGRDFWKRKTKVPMKAATMNITIRIESIFFISSHLAVD